MKPLTPQMFGALPRKELDELLTLHTDHLTQPYLTPAESHARVTSLMFTQTLRSLTLPDPQPTIMLTKRHIPEYPMSFRQLKEWKEATIVKYISHPLIDEYQIRQRQHLLYMLSQLTFKE